MNYFLILILISFSISENPNSVKVNVRRSKIHKDKTGLLTPLVASITSKDLTEKIKPTDMICIVDISGSMSGDNIRVVKESLSYLVDNMKKEDQLALVSFSSSSDILSDFLPMNPENKERYKGFINNLVASGGTNIYAGLEKGLSLLKNNYSNGERIATMILLSDGLDNYQYGRVADNFLNLLNSTGKIDYSFTIQSFGYGHNHDANLMYNISKIKSGGFFYIQRLKQVQDAILKIYGSASTTCMTNVQVKIESNFRLDTIYGIDDMETPILSNKNKTFTTKITQFVCGKNYNYVFLVDIPENTAIKTKILTFSVSPPNVSGDYLWDGKLDRFAYEEYIRCISFTIIIQAVFIYKNGRSSNSILIIEEGIKWIQLNYDGQRDWVKEYNIFINDFKSINSYEFNGMADILSKLRELTTPQIGINYNNNDNTFINKIIEGSHEINVTKNYTTIDSEVNFYFNSNINCYNFIVKEGAGELNDFKFFFFEEGTSIAVCSEQENDTFKIKPLEGNFSFYNTSEYVSEIKTKINPMKGNKFFIKKNFPLSFYSEVDGLSDITFNIQLFSIKSNISLSYNISVYVLTENEIINKILPDNSKKLTLNTTDIFIDPNFNIGKVVIKKEQIVPLLSSAYNSFLYVLIESSNNFTEIRGQSSFVSMNNMFSPIPEGFIIYSNLEKNQKSPHLYTLKMDPKLGNKIMINFIDINKELDIKVLTQKNYPIGSEDLYKDSDDFNVTREYLGNQTYLELKQATEEDNVFDNIIVSIFPKNWNETDNKVIDNNNVTNATNNTEPSSKEENKNLSYILQYSTLSNHKKIDFFIGKNTEDDKIFPVQPSQYVNDTIQMTHLYIYKYTFSSSIIMFNQFSFSKHKIPKYHFYIKVIYIFVKVVNSRRLEKVKLDAGCLYTGEDLAENENGNLVEYECKAKSTQDIEGVLDEDGNSISEKKASNIYINAFNKVEDLGLISVKSVKERKRFLTSESTRKIVLSGKANKCTTEKKYVLDFDSPKVNGVECTLSDTCTSLTCPLKLEEGKEYEVKIDQSKNIKENGEDVDVIFKTSDGEFDYLILNKKNENNMIDEGSPRKVNHNNNSSLSGGAIAAIVIVSVIVVGLTIFILLYCSSKPKISQTESSVKDSKNVYINTSKI